MPRSLRPPKIITDRQEVAQDGPLQVLLTKTPTDGAQWIEENVTDVASAKKALKILTKAVIALSHRI